MHELAICRALIDQVEAIAREHGANRVLSIAVTIGPLAGVEPALLESAYSLASEGTLARGARLLLERSTVRVRCCECDAESVVASNCLVCHRCASWRTEVLTGEELLLASVELEKECIEYV